MIPTSRTAQKAQQHKRRAYILWIKKNSFDFGNALRTSMNVRVPIWNDFFEPRSFQVRTAISDHAIRTIRGVISTTIADDRVVGDGGCDREAVHGHHASR